jgi:hypothetical protein
LRILLGQPLVHHAYVQFLIATAKYATIILATGFRASTRFRNLSLRRAGLDWS